MESVECGGSFVVKRIIRWGSAKTVGSFTVV